jgi:hypothetical protein
MQLETDARLVAELAQIGLVGYGEYLGTFVSEHGQVRADLFRRGGRLEAHVSFPAGLSGSTVTDRYVSHLLDYAKEHGFAERPRIIYS